MSKSSTLRLLALIAVCALACAAAYAGGPLLLFDPPTKTPYSWPGGYAPVYTDMGGLGQLSNPQANAMVQAGITQWNNVPTSSFNGAIVGDFQSIGLPDITAANLGLVLGPYNGGGVHVIYDEDGSITESIFGSPYVALGVTIVEWVSDTNSDILESTMILNGTGVPEPPTSPEDAAAMYGGVATHEFGHAINLAHSQTNGQIYFYYDPWTGPAGCNTPYTGSPGGDDIETMYPITSVYSTGVGEASVDVLDDMAALSDIYPAAGWPGAQPAISGTILAAPRATSHQGSPVTGANVIARNLADPWKGATSAISGDFTQGLAGPDGSYAFHGLAPGASYVVYVDGIVVGAFATPVPTVLPGPEEYWNGGLEAGNGETDDRCQWTTLAPAAGSPVTADITFNKVQGAPTFLPIDLPLSNITELDAAGDAAVGLWDGGVYRWTPNGLEDLGARPRSPQAGISADGQKIAAQVEDEFGIGTAAIWQAGQGWTSIGAVAGSQSCDSDLSSGWGITNARSVVGLNWDNCVTTEGFLYTPNTGMTGLGFFGPADDLGGSRADRISADGGTVVGWDRDPTGFWRGTQWRNGVESLFSRPPVLCCDGDPRCSIDFVGTAEGVNPNGSIIVGEGYFEGQVYVDPDTQQEYHYCSSTGWKWTPGGGVQSLGGFIPDYSPKALDVSDDGDVIVGVADPFDFFLPRRPVLWTEATGFIDFQEFLAAQGTYAQDWLLQVVGTVSGDGRTFGGFGYSPFSIQGFVVQMDKVVICHAPPGNPSNKHTVAVAFPNGLKSHLAHGDTIGMCAGGQ